MGIEVLAAHANGLEFFLSCGILGAHLQRGVAHRRGQILVLRGEGNVFMVRLVATCG